MTDQTNAQPVAAHFPNRTVYGLALFFVLVGILNSMPTIPGWDELWRTVSGFEKLKVRNFATESLLSDHLLYHDVHRRAKAFNVARLAGHKPRVAWAVYGCRSGDCSSDNLPYLFD